MNRLSTLFFLFLFTITSFSQNRVVIPKELRNISKTKTFNVETAKIESKDKNNYPVNQSQALVNRSKEAAGVFEEQVGTTVYDLQSNGVMHRRIHKFDDGTIATVWTMGFDAPLFAERGTGYNYFDGNSWAPFPSEAIESERTGWPSIAPWGENGEIICSHNANNNVEGLMINRRENKGQGNWTEVLFEGPPNPDIPGEKMNILWPTMVTGGFDFQTMHVLAVTAPEANGGDTYYGQDGALLYSRSNDGGESWEIEHHLFEELNADYYNFIRYDSYIWAEPKGEHLAFLVTCSWMDAVLMKSDNGGDSWTKTLIWEHPYPLFDWQTTVTDTFYCADNSGCIALDEDGMAHIAFGLTRLFHDNPGSSYTNFPFTDGVVYWNGNMPGFSSGLNTLNPYGHPDSELMEDYNLVGWTQDVDGNGEIELLDNIITYKQHGISTIPQIVCSEYNRLYLLFSSTTETYENGIYNYKHIWARTSPNAGLYWGSFEDLNSSVIHIYDECIFPSIASRTHDNLISFTFQYNYDSEAGLATNGDHNWSDNSIIVGDYVIEVGIKTNSSNGFSVTKIQPNPAKDFITFYINTPQPGIFFIEICDFSGRKISAFSRRLLSPGKHKVGLDVSSYSSGIYFLKVKSGEMTVIRKMVIH
ncbi:MAG: T9SS type A sorting domain-containing protein [Bacteroidales bacterium]|nr:T9SS type A sorting domain-containing protein [Bacteroidales bacterium]